MINLLSKMILNNAEDDFNNTDKTIMAVDHKQTTYIHQIIIMMILLTRQGLRWAWWAKD